MWIPAFILVFVLGVSAAPSPFQSCGPQNIVLKQVTDTWSLPVTKMAPMSTCTYSFVIPNGTFAEIDLSATNLSNEDTIYAVGIEQAFGGPNETYHLTTLSPTKFDVTFMAEQNSTMTVQFSVNLQTVNSAVADSFRVMSNDESKLLYLDAWKAGTSYQVTADTLLHLNVAFNGINSGTLASLNNIFVFDGENTPATILGAQSSFFLSTNKKVSLYLARKITDLQGALFLTDNSNLNGTINHHAEFVPTDGYPTSYVSMNADWQYKPNSPWGAVTIVGKADGSTPFDVRQLYTMSGNGTFYYTNGGPLPNHSNGRAFGNKNLPLRASGSVNTFYLSQGSGNMRYTVV